MYKKLSYIYFAMKNYSKYFDVLLTVHLIIILVINQKCTNSCFIISLLYSSTCFEHYVLIIRRSKLYDTASGIITPVHGTATYRCDDTRWWCTNSCFIISLLYSSTCFEHYVLINRKSKLYYTAFGITKPVGGRPVHRTATYRVWWYQMLYNKILTAWWWAHSARNM